MSPRKSSSRPVTTPFTIRLTDEERRELQRRAGELAIGTFIKLSVFADGDKRKRRGQRVPVKDHVMLAQLLACLGSSRIAESLETLAKAADTGTLAWDSKAPEAIRKACQDIVAIRLMLMKSLGFQIDDAALEESLSQSFTRAARDDGLLP